MKWSRWLPFAFGVAIADVHHAQHPISGSKATQARPNLVFIMSDDQDLHMDSLSYMPLLKKHVVDQGLTFTRHYCTVALCCPSRASLLTGKAAHNTNVTDIVSLFVTQQSWLVVSKMLPRNSFHSVCPMEQQGAMASRRSIFHFHSLLNAHCC